MIINKVYIENFGTLSNTTFNFSEGLTEIVENNGFGKTTLLVFIKAMLYGVQKHDGIDERKQYAPWNKGVFGGSLFITHKNKNYKIERYFGIRPSQDELTIYSLPELKILNVENPGLYFLGIDEQSFVRSNFITENMLQDKTPSSLICELTKNNQTKSDDSNNFDEAMKILDKKRAYYFKQGGKGKIAENKENLNFLQRQLENINTKIVKCDTIDKNILFLKDEEELLKSKLNTCEQKIEKATKQESTTQTRNQYIFLCSNKQELEMKIENNKKILNGQNPTEKEISTYQSKATELNNITKTINENEQFINECEENSMLNNFEEKKALCNKFVANCSNKNSAFLSVSTWLSFTIFAVLSFVLFLINKFIFAIVCTIVCVIFFVVALTLKTKTTQNAILKKLQEKFNNPNLKTSTDIVNELQKMEKLNAEIASKKESNLLLKEQACILEKELQTTLQYYNFNNHNYYDNLNEIWKSIVTKNELENQLNKINEQITKFDSASLEDVDTSLNLESLKKEKADFLKDIESVKTKIISSTHEKENLFNDIEQAPEIQANIEHKKEEIEEDEKILQNIQFTSQYIEKAKQSLSNKFIVPTQNKLNNLIQNFPHFTKFEPIILKEDLTIAYETNGKTRSEKSLSLGLQHCFQLLARFALISTIFNEEKTTIFLDDTFSFLDEKNMQLMAELIHNLSHNYQIVYITCHKARKLK